MASGFRGLGFTPVARQCNFNFYFFFSQLYNFRPLERPTDRSVFPTRRIIESCACKPLRAFKDKHSLGWAMMSCRRANSHLHRSSSVWNIFLLLVIDLEHWTDWSIRSWNTFWGSLRTQDVNPKGIPPDIMAFNLDHWHRRYNVYVRGGNRLLDIFWISTGQAMTYAEP